MAWYISAKIGPEIGRSGSTSVFFCHAITPFWSRGWGECPSHAYLKKPFLCIYVVGFIARLFDFGLSGAERTQHATHGWKSMRAHIIHERSPKFEISPRAGQGKRKQNYRLFSIERLGKRITQFVGVRSWWCPKFAFAPPFIDRQKRYGSASP